MSRELTTVSTVWLELLRAQRPMKLPEILPELDKLRYSALRLGYQLGYFERTGKRHHYEYRVTPACTVPPGVPIHEILEATS